jgi:hypothetical protein
MRVVPVRPLKGRAVAEGSLDVDRPFGGSRRVDVDLRSDDMIEILTSHLPDHFEDLPTFGLRQHAGEWGVLA